MSPARALACTLVLAACGKSAPDPAPAAEPVRTAPVDAAVDGISQIGSYDPASGGHLDDDEPATATATRPTKRGGRPIEIMLRSTPGGARAYVDGNFVGVTPTYWPGETGAEHEFTFSMPQYGLARYRFFAVQTGVLHARLEQVSGDVGAGVVPPPHLVEPPPSLVGPEPVVVPTVVDAAPAMDAPPPPTVSAPIDAATTQPTTLF